MKAKIDLSVNTQVINKEGNLYEIETKLSNPLCACGCGKRIENYRPNKVYYNSSCRTRDYRRRLKQSKELEKVS